MVITPSHIIEYLFCPRFTWFEHVLAIPQYEGRHYKVIKGRNVHDEKLARNKDYLRKRIGAKEKWLDQYLTNPWLRGKVDEVLLLDDGTLAPLDYKFARFENKIYSTYKTQLYCYAWLIEENFGKQVRKGFLVYTRSKNKLIEIEILEADKLKVKNCVNEINAIINGNLYPKAPKYKKRCLTCTYRNICTK
ncbi:MAG: CRISPR-associated protein Cas4 [Prolixibacteraceae bacterium]|nr:CRISPR-associated protein Cas4 [Prolixibacteraceae bacterium]